MGGHSFPSGAQRFPACSLLLGLRPPGRESPPPPKPEPQLLTKAGASPPCYFPAQGPSVSSVARAVASGEGQLSEITSSSCPVSVIAEPGWASSAHRRWADLPTKALLQRKGELPLACAVTKLLWNKVSARSGGRETRSVVLVSARLCSEQSRAGDAAILAAWPWCAALAVIPDIPSEPEPECEKKRFEWSDILNLKNIHYPWSHYFSNNFYFSFKDRS